MLSRVPLVRVVEIDRLDLDSTSRNGSALHPEHVRFVVRWGPVCVQEREREVSDLCVWLIFESEKTYQRNIIVTRTTHQGHETFSTLLHDRDRTCSSYRFNLTREQISCSLQRSCHLWHGRHETSKFSILGFDICLKTCSHGIERHLLLLHFSTKCLIITTITSTR